MFCILFKLALLVASVSASVVKGDTYISANLTDDAPMNQVSLLQTDLAVQGNRWHWRRPLRGDSLDRDSLSRRRQRMPLRPILDPDAPPPSPAVAVAAPAPCPGRSTIPAMRVPLVVHQTYITAEGDLMQEARDARSKWREMHPEGLLMSYMDEDDISTFMEAHFDARVMKAWHAMPIGVMKADFWRYAVVYIYGGIYADVDVVPKMSIDSWFQHQMGRPPMSWDEAGCSIVLGMENDQHISNWAFAGVEKHPVLNRTIELIVERALAGVNTSMEHFVHYHTGPGVFTDAVKEYFSSTSDRCVGAHPRSDIIKMFKSNACVLSPPRWEHTVQNLFASQNFHHGYHRWIEDITYWAPVDPGSKEAKIEAKKEAEDPDKDNRWWMNLCSFGTLQGTELAACSNGSSIF